MSKIDDGGPAFPWEDMRDSSGVPMPNPGMTLRDYFAGQALAGIAKDAISEYHRLGGSVGWIKNAIDTMPSEDDPCSLSAAALSAYEMADAMIAQRSKS